jgi:hypothetical protein
VPDLRDEDIAPDEPGMSADHMSADQVRIRRIVDTHHIINVLYVLSSLITRNRRASLPQRLRHLIADAIGQGHRHWCAGASIHRAPSFGMRVTLKRRGAMTEIASTRRDAATHALLSVLGPAGGSSSARAARGLS